jgi:hypothetical protein
MPYGGGFLNGPLWLVRRLGDRLWSGLIRPSGLNGPLGRLGISPYGHSPTGQSERADSKKRNDAKRK